MTQEQYNLICVAIQNGLGALYGELVGALNNVLDMAKKYQELTKENADKQKEVN